MKHLTLAGLALILAASAAVAAPPDQARTLTVTGTGIAMAAPDEASFSTGVVNQAATAGAALAANSKAMAAVITTLKQQGVPEKAIQTSNITLSPQYQSCKPNVACPQKIVGYEVADTLTVTIGIDKAGVALDALVAAGANQINGIGFSIHNDKPLLAQARADAVKEAIAKAEAYAKAAGVGLGPIQSIQEGSFEAPRPVNMLMGYRDKAGAVPLEGGEEKFAATVTITWIIN